MALSPLGQVSSRALLGERFSQVWRSMMDPRTGRDIGAIKKKGYIAGTQAARFKLYNVLIGVGSFATLFSAIVYS